MTTVLLVHGGLWEVGMDGLRFWAEPGITCTGSKGRKRLATRGTRPAASGPPALRHMVR